MMQMDAVEGRVINQEQAEPVFVQAPEDRQVRNESVKCTKQIESWCFVEWYEEVFKGFIVCLFFVFLNQVPVDETPQQ